LITGKTAKIDPGRVIADEESKLRLDIMRHSAVRKSTICEERIKSFCVFLQSDVKYYM